MGFRRFPDFQNAREVFTDTGGNPLPVPQPAAGLTNNVAAVVRALEAAGVEFIEANGGGAGVRLRKAAGGKK